MCGIAGIIYSDGARDVGRDMTRMLQSMKHRGPDSTGYALFGPHAETFVLRYTLADADDPRDFEFAERIRRNKFVVEQRLREVDATIQDVVAETESANRGTIGHA